MRVAPSDKFVRLTRRPDLAKEALQSPVRFEPAKKEKGSFVLTRHGLEEVK
jgi:hypothetical protein